MRELTDWAAHLDVAVSNMSRQRRILYFRSENRKIIRDAVNGSLALWERLGLPPTAEEDRYQQLVRNYQCFPMTQLFKPGGVLGSVKFREGVRSQTGERVPLIPRLATISDFQVFAERDRAQMVKAFLDCPELETSLLLIASPQVLIPDGFSNEIELIPDVFITQRDIFRKLRAQVRLEEQARKQEFYTDAELTKFAGAFVGLTGEQVDNVLTGMEGTLCPGLAEGVHLELIRKERQGEAGKDPAIRFIELPERETVAGLGNFTRWLSQRAEDFADPARARLQGTPAPKGVLLCGVPGTGKTAMARETARILNVPLIQFDISRIQGSKLGESEARLRRYLDRISAFGACVMLMDEIEKTFSVNDSTHEVKLAMLGLLLDWMQTRKANVLTFITANDISRLPPELLRDGRISGRFFAFMPMRDDLAAIMRLKLRPLIPSRLFNQELTALIQAPADPKDRLAQGLDLIAQDAVRQAERGEIRTPFLTGANMETLMEMTLRALREEKQPPYSAADFVRQMRACAASGAFIPQGQSNLADLVSMWLKAQQRQYQDVSDHTVLPFNRFKDGQFAENLPVPEGDYDRYFQKTLREEIEKSCRRAQEDEQLRQKALQRQA